MINNEPKLVKLAIDLIEFPEWNPREISIKEFKKLQSDIKKDPDFLKQRPPLINFLTAEKKYICYAGNQRGKAAAANGEKEIWVWVQNDIPKEVQDARMLKDNLHRGEWDWDKLKLFDIEFLHEAGFEFMEMGNLFKESNAVEDDKFDFDSAVDEIKVPKTKPGDIYILGEHRLMCGNSQNEEDVNRLMDGDVADIIYCDPPYNIGLSYDKGVKPSAIKKRYTNAVFSDNMSNSDYTAWLIQIVHNAMEVTKPDFHIFFWCDPKFIGLTQEAYRRLKISNKSVAFWIKDQFNPTLQMAFHRLIEPCVYGTKGSPKLNDQFRNMTEILNKEVAGRKIFESLMDYTDMWTIAREVSQNYVHPTQKPCTLHEKPLNRCSFPGHIIIDLFGGSGSTLISCEQMQRKARLMELDPVFCDVIVNRWEVFTGKKAIIRNGKKEENTAK